MNAVGCRGRGEMTAERRSVARFAYNSYSQVRRGTAAPEGWNERRRWCRKQTSCSRDERLFRLFVLMGRRCVVTARWWVMVSCRSSQPTWRGHNR